MLSYFKACCFCHRYSRSFH